MQEYSYNDWIKEEKLKLSNYSNITVKTFITEYNKFFRRYLWITIATTLYDSKQPKIVDANFRQYTISAILK